MHEQATDVKDGNNVKPKKLLDRAGDFGCHSKRFRLFRGPLAELRPTIIYGEVIFHHSLP